jgi:hypothetical protein
MTCGTAYSNDMKQELTVVLDLEDGEVRGAEGAPPLTREDRQAIRLGRRLAQEREEALAAGRKMELRRPRPFTYTWSDLEAAFGRSKRQLQRWVARGDFDPADFASVAKLLRTRQ